MLFLNGTTRILGIHTLVTRLHVKFDGGNMALSEEEISYLEEHIPDLASAASWQAYWAALAAGCSVLISENGNLIEVFPNGNHKFIKRLSPPIRVTPGKRIKINE